MIREELSKIDFISTEGDVRNKNDRTAPTKYGVRNSRSSIFELVKILGKRSNNAKLNIVDAAYTSMSSDNINFKIETNHLNEYHRGIFKEL